MVHSFPPCMYSECMGLSHVLGFCVMEGTSIGMYRLSFPDNLDIQHKKL